MKRPCPSACPRIDLTAKICFFFRSMQSGRYPYGQAFPNAQGARDQQVDPKRLRRRMVREQLEAEPTPSTTEVLLVNAQLLGVENDGDEQRAQVFFDVLMRESPDQQAPSSVREVWHFVRPIAGGSWKLDGIQQVD